MPNLNSYINFNVVLDNSSTTPKLVLTDTTPYRNMGGIDLSDICIGIFAITQPDGVTITSNFNTPDTYPNVNRLYRVLPSGDNRVLPKNNRRYVAIANAARVTVVNKELRLGVDELLQNGLYTFTFTVRTPNYDDSVITKTFNLDYNNPKIVIDNDINLFIPYIKSKDNTFYTQTRFDAPTIARLFSGEIDNVLGIKKTVVSTTNILDYQYNSKYYDAKYNGTFSYVSTYVASGDNSWLSIKEKGFTTFSFDAYTLATLNTLNCFVLSEQYIRFISGCKDKCDNDCPTGININKFVLTVDAIYKKYCIVNLKHTNNIIIPYDLSGNTNVGGVITLAVPTVQWTAPTNLILEIVEVISATPINFGVGTAPGLDDIYSTFAVNGDNTSSYVHPMTAGQTIYFTGGISTTQIKLYTR